MHCEVAQVITPFHSLKDLQAVSLVGWFDLMMLVKADSPYRTLADLLGVPDWIAQRIWMGEIGRAHV